MKKLLFAGVIVVLAAALIGGGFVAAEICQNIDYDISALEPVGSSLEIVSDTQDGVTVKKTVEGNFKVLMFTDIHLNGKKETDKTAVEMLVKNITEEKPDLVLLGGDSISSGFNKKRTKQLVEILEKTGVYWAAVLGNHESEGIFTYSRKEFVELFASQEHCLVRMGKEDIDGFGNCTITLLGSNDEVQQVIFLMDSGNYMTDELKQQYGVENEGQVYDGVKESQVEWYKAKHDELTQELGSFKSTLLLHIPLYQTKQAPEDEILGGAQREGICESGFDSGLFDALREKGTTENVFFGHDHLNDFSFVCDGIMLNYIQPSGYSSYTMESSLGSPENEWIQGCTAVVFENGSVYTKDLFNHQ